MCKGERRLKLSPLKDHTHISAIAWRSMGVRTGQWPVGRTGMRNGRCTLQAAIDLAPNRRAGVCGWRVREHPVGPEIRPEQLVRRCQRRLKGRCTASAAETVKRARRRDCCAPCCGSAHVSTQPGSRAADRRQAVTGHEGTSVSPTTGTAVWETTAIQGWYAVLVY